MKFLKRFTLPGAVVTLVTLAATSTCVLFGSPTLAKYVASAQGQAGAHIAKWDVSHTFTVDSHLTGNGTADQYRLVYNNVQNRSENKAPLVKPFMFATAETSYAFSFTLTNNSEVGAYGQVFCKPTALGGITDNGTANNAANAPTASFTTGTRTGAVTDAPQSGKTMAQTARYFFPPNSSVVVNATYTPDNTKFNLIGASTTNFDTMPTYVFDFWAEWAQAD
jgi:hypothetical protein